MDEPAPMDGAERIGNLRADFEQPIPRERRAGDQLAERPALEQLADEERSSVLLAGFVHRADVGMRHQRRDPRFAVEPFDRARFRDFSRPQQFDRDLPIESQVAGAMNLGGAVPANQL